MVTVTVEPSRYVNRAGGLEDLVKVGQAMMDGLALAALAQHWIVRHQQSRPIIKAFRKLHEALKLRTINVTGRIPWGAVASGGIEADKPEVANTLGKRVSGIIDAYAALPECEYAFESAGLFRLRRVVIVISGNRQAGHCGDGQDDRSMAALGLETERGGIA
jgi:hypothetical protein